LTEARWEAAEKDEAIAKLKKAFEFLEEQTVWVSGMRYDWRPMEAVLWGCLFATGARESTAGSLG
jgi:hypothetical protein